MGRVLTAFLAALAVLSAALAKSEEQPRLLKHSRDDPASRDAVSDLIETIRRIILEGSKDPYVPVLDPFQLESQNLSLNEIGAYEVKAGLRNVVSTGLGDFIATMSSRYSMLLRAYVTVDISIPVLNAQGRYFLNTLLGEVVRLNGDGNFNLDLRELNVTVDVEIGLGIFSSQLRRLTTIIDVGDFQLVVDGLLEGGVVDDIFNLAVNEVAKIIFDSQKSVLEDYLASILAEPISEVLADIGMSDLLCLIGLCGNGDGDGDSDSSVIDSGDTDGSGEGGSGDGGTGDGDSGEGGSGDGGTGDGDSGEGGSGDGGNGDGDNGDGGSGDGGSGDGGNGDGGNGDGGNGDGDSGDGGSGDGGSGDGGDGEGDGNEVGDGGRAHYRAIGL